MPDEENTNIGLQESYRDVSGPISIAVEATMVLANLFPVVVVLKFKRSRERLATDELILALSITDILSVVIPSPLGLTAYFTRRWHGGLWGCDFYQLSVVWFQLASMCLVTFMCIDRFVGLKDAMRYKTPCNNHRRIRISVLFIYLVTLLLACLPLFGMAPRALSSTGILCQSWIISTPRYIKEHIFYLTFLTVGYANLTIAVVANIIIITTLWEFQRKFGNSTADRLSSAALQIDRRTVVEFSVMIILVTTAFYLAWLPALIMVTLQKTGLNVNHITVLYALLSTTLTGLLNPVIYGIFSRTYRKNYMKILLAISKFLFGCPVTQRDVLNDVSSQANRLRSAGSTSNSLAALLSNRSDVGTDNQGASFSGNLDTSPMDHSCRSPSHDSYRALLDSNYSSSYSSTNNTQPQLVILDPKTADYTHSNDANILENTYLDDNTRMYDTDDKMTDDLYGSSLSLMTDDSDSCEVCSIVSYEEDQRTRFLQFQGIIQESMI